MRVDLPTDGAWVELRDPETIIAGDQEDLMRQMPKPDEGRPFDFAYDLTTGLKLLMIKDWYVPYLSDPHALPVANPKLLRELRLPDNHKLEEALAPARALLFPTPAEPSDKQLEDPGSPTTPANA
ncbi:MAG TPA: hypothetical protein VGJ13_05270 [Pseudonocardiaceae bacterium]|jgi:hypothetical protein